SVDLLEQRQMDFAVLLEYHANAVAYIDCSHAATHDVGGEIHARRAVDCDPRDHEWHLQPRAPFLVVDGERIDSAGSRDDFTGYVQRQALPAHRTRRMNESPAVLAAQKPQLAVRPAGPEEAVLRI